MPKKAKAKKVSQNDLRKMMNEMKSKRNVPSNDRRTLETNSDEYRKAMEDRKRIDQLKKGIILPKVAANNEKNSDSRQTISTSLQPATKRTISATEDATSEQFKEPLSKIAKLSSSERNQTKKAGGLIIGDYGSSSDDEDDSDKKKNEDVEMKEVPEENLEKNSDKNPETSLPEGFFDDPEIDAKIRGVETPSSAMDREWEDFQREIQKETGQSEQIVEEEEETGKVDREIDEINEQILHFTRVEKLNDARDAIKEKLKSAPKTDPIEEAQKLEESESDDESIEDDVLDWREKDSQF